MSLAIISLMPPLLVNAYNIFLFRKYKAKMRIQIEKNMAKVKTLDLTVDVATFRKHYFKTSKDFDLEVYKTVRFLFYANFFLMGLVLAVTIWEATK
jgi:hypothetical protein